MARSTTSELIMSLIDRVSGPARRVGSAVRGLNGTVRDSAGVQVGMADRIAAAQMRTEGALDRARIGVLETVGAYFLLRDAVSAPIRAAAAFETQLEDIGQKAGIPVEQLGALGEQIKQVARDTNQATSSIAAAIDALVGRGASQDVALAAAAPIGKAATAYRASTDDLASAAWAAVDNLKVPADQIETVMDMMATAGKEGAFELRDMAQYFPALGAAYQALGQEGVGSVADLAAALQVVRKGTGDSASAATNLANVLQKMRSPATVRAFKRMGVSLEESLEEAAERGLSPIEAIAEVTQKALGGDLKKLGYLFEDAQAQAGIRSLIQGMDEYNRIRDKATDSKGVVDADFERRTRTAAGAMERWNASVQNLNIALGTSLLPLLNDVLDRIIPMIDRVGELAAAYPEATSNIMAAGGALLAFKAAVATLSFIGLTGKSGALSLLSAAFGNVQGAAGAAATAVESSVARQNAAASRLKIGAMAAGLQAWNLVSSVPTEPDELAEFQKQKRENIENNLRSAPIIGSMMGAYDKLFSALRGHAPLTYDQAARDAELQSAQASIEAAARVQELRARQEELIAKVEAQVDKTGRGFDMAAQDTAMELMNVQHELVAAEAGSIDLEEALKAIGMVQVSPNVDSTLLDAALRKATELRAALLLSAGSSGGGAPALDGRRAKGGPISRGKTYLVGENGPEIVTASKSGYVHPTGQGARMVGGESGAQGGGVHIGAINVAPSLSFPNATIQDAEAIAQTVMARIKDEIGSAMRGVMADVSMG